MSVMLRRQARGPELLNTLKTADLSHGHVAHRQCRVYYLASGELAARRQSERHGGKTSFLEHADV